MLAKTSQEKCITVVSCQSFHTLTGVLKVQLSTQRHKYCHTSDLLRHFYIYIFCVTILRAHEVKSLHISQFYCMAVMYISLQATFSMDE